MSQQELEQTDREVMEMVNRTAAPDTMRRADQIEAAMKGASPEELAESEVGRLHKVYCRKQKIRTGLCVAACLLITVVLLIVLFAPTFLVWVVNAGILCCGIVAGIALDRQCRNKV